MRVPIQTLSPHHHLCYVNFLGYQTVFDGISVPIVAASHHYQPQLLATGLVVVHLWGEKFNLNIEVVEN